MLLQLRRSPLLNVETANRHVLDVLRVTWYCDIYSETQTLTDKTITSMPGTVVWKYSLSL